MTAYGARRKGCLRPRPLRHAVDSTGERGLVPAPRDGPPAKGQRPDRRLAQGQFWKRPPGDPCSHTPGDFACADPPLSPPSFTRELALFDVPSDSRLALPCPSANNPSDRNRAPLSITL